ncbi:uncharacterized protein isoform X2 [Rhodnius prolixus]|uniref:uncharacterized protein isoform X2 n=1 Tax=Rhodnius prolixus TaxID=13249 RepID=UPI003D18A7E5
MAVPMRETSSGQATQPAQTTTAANFVEYDDNEWDVGIGDLIIDLDADIEKTGVGDGSGAGGGMAAPKPAQAKMHSPAVEHQATVDKGLKMKIKRTKPGTKHEIVKSGENGERQTGGHGGAKRGSSSHRREKKHSGSGTGNEKTVTSGTSTASSNVSSNGKEGVNGLVRVVTYPVSGSTQQQSAPAVQTAEQPHQLLPTQAQPKKSKSTGVVASGSTTSSGPSGAPVAASTSAPAAGVSTPLGPPPLLVGAIVPSSPPPPLHPAPGLAPVQAVQTGQSVAAQVTSSSTASLGVSAPAQSPQPDTTAPPPTLPLQSKELVDVCVGTSVGTITEPDCLGPCEPGTSVTLEGIVWHETEGVLVVNVTWRGKTYVGTLLDCTKHDWAPPRFCDSPTSDMDARTPKGRGKRGRSAANAGASDLSNFTETRSSVHSKLRSQNTAGGKGRRGPGAGSPTPFATPKVESSQGKRKSKNHEEEPNPKRKVGTQNNSTTASSSAQISVPPPPAAAPQTAQATSPLPPPALLECPEPNCSKKYKHINGLKYHQSHAHGSPDDEDTKESVTSEEEEPAEVKKEDPPEIAPSIIPVAVPQPVVHEEQEPPEEEMTIQVPTPPSPVIQEEPTPQPPVLTKVPQFKVKPASALMPEEKKPVPQSPTKTQPQSHKKKNRKSPSASPHPTPLEPPALGLETSRDDVQSPAYSDISDDAAPLLEAEVEGKPKTADKKESGQSPQLQHYGIYPYYGQPPYLVPSVSEKPKESPEKTEKPLEKEKKEGEYPQQKILSQHYYQYGYHVPGYPYNMEGYPVVIDEKKDEKSQPEKPALHIPNPPKPKTETITTAKEKHQNENHQILKESIEMKNQVNPAFLYQRQNSQQGQEDMRRFYIYPERKEAKATPPPQKTHPSPSPKHKDKEEKKEEKKQEGVKPTMETQGPPPPPTSQYAYIHPGYMQSPHYGPLPFDHSMYRGMNPMLVSGYANSPYLHPQLHAVPRYGPEDLSRGQSGKALDLLQHHASQYYPHPSHKIHELQERAIKSPTPKGGSQSGSSPTTALQSANAGGGPAGAVTVGPGGSVVPVTSAPAAAQTQNKSATVAEPKDSRSPPPQRHVHTHHHTHVGLGYPILAGQYPTPYGAAVLATEHAAAVTSVPYQGK